MQPHPRYDILTPLASGEFATVYRGLDRELNREVAIKQIHAQYLQDPRQLELFWREAQLLAALEHPHIMTIYDIVRPRGWLVLELMQGTVAEAARGAPFDLDRLREVLISSLQALAFLHGKKVIHGDIKPTNIFFDRRGQVKLGDFGLARRATNEQGSLLKGATKYIAPELVSDHFGPVGPHSDLYSLGFSAYELLCGEHFEQLFPGLAAAGPNKQLQWLMWHAAPDRRLPQIARVMEGVPADLAGVIERLTQKNTQQRYRTAADALADLKMPADASLPRNLEEAEAEQARREAARKRRLAIIAAAVSLVLSAIMVFWPSAPKKAPPAEAPPPDDKYGIVRNIVEGQRIIILEVPTSDAARPERPEISIHPEDRILINDKVSIFNDLKLDDQVMVRRTKDDKGRIQQEVIASRPRDDRGVVQEIRTDEGRLIIKLEEGSATEKLDLVVPPGAEIQINGRLKSAGAAYTLAALKPGDRVAVKHFPEQRVEKLRSLTALRTVTAEGVVRQVDATKQEISLTLGADDSGKLTVLPLAPRCEVSLNGMRFIEKRVLTAADLRPGDKVTLEHDTHLKRINAQRSLTLAGVVRSIRYDVASLDVQPDQGGERVLALVPGTAPVQLGGELAAFDDLRSGDHVSIAHESVDKKGLSALSIDAVRPPDPSKGLLIVAGEKFDDAQVGQVPQATADALWLKDACQKRYAVPPEQVHLLLDETRIRLEAALPAAIEKLRGVRQLTVYVTGAALVDEKGTVYLATRETSPSRLSATAVTLKWLIDVLEASPIASKALFLDLARSGQGGGASLSTAEMVDTIRGTRKNPGLKTLLVVASCAKGERGRMWKDPPRGAFAHLLGEGFAGAADKNRDLTVDVTESLEHVKQGLLTAAPSLGGPQTPVLIRPDATPPRISEDAKKSIQKLGLLVSQPQIDLLAVSAAFSEANRLVPQQPEPKLLNALALAKGKQLDKALNQLSDLKLNYPKHMLAWELNAWLHFESKKTAAGVAELTQLFSRLPPAKSPDDVPAKEHQHLFLWAGRLREYAESLAPTNKPSEDALGALDAAVEKQGRAAIKAYQMGREACAKIRSDFDRQITDDNIEEIKRIQTRLERPQLRHYASFPYDVHIQRALSTLDDE